MIFLKKVYSSIYFTNFNQDISKWNVANVNLFTDMFLNCKNFNYGLNNWNVTSLKDETRSWGKNSIKERLGDIMKNTKIWYAAIAEWNI